MSLQLFSWIWHWVFVHALVDEPPPPVFVDVVVTFMHAYLAGLARKSSYSAGASSITHTDVWLPHVSE